MPNNFSQQEVSLLLAVCHRCCCICHRFCGVKIELDHIIPRVEQGTDEIDNAIPVCFECHAEIHSYNDNHPRGRKYRPDELRKHKDQWISICQDRPDILVEVHRSLSVGPLQSLIDELDFNLHVSQNAEDTQVGCPFADEQFRRAIAEGAISVLNEELKSLILEAYRVTNRANQTISPAFSTPSGMIKPQLLGEVVKATQESTAKISAARSALLAFLTA